MAHPFRYQSRYTNFFLLYTSIVLSLVTAEVVLLLAGRGKPPRYPPKCVYVNPTCSLYEQFEPHGYRLVPSQTTKYYYPYRAPWRRCLTMISNRHGFRSKREFEEKDNRIRIIVLGDSQVFGEGVEESERFTNIMETILQSSRVDNLAMPGYGAGLMLRTLETVGLRLNPDIVVFSMYAGDFERVHPCWAGIGFKIPRFILKNDQLVSIPYPKPHFIDHFHFYRAICNAYWKYTNTEMKLNAAIFDRFIELAKIHSFMPIFIFIPQELDTRKAKERRAWLQQYTQQHDILFLDLTNLIHKMDYKKVFIKKNPHLNLHGHYIVATEIVRFLTVKILDNFQFIKR